MHVDIAVIDDNPEMLRQFQEIIGQLQSLTYAGESVSTQVHPFLSNWPLDVRGFAQQIAKKSPGVVVVDMRLVSDDLEELTGVDLGLRLKSLLRDCCIGLVSSYFNTVGETSLFRHLDIFRELVDRGDVAAEVYEGRLMEATKRAILTHVSGLNYRKFRFVSGINHKEDHMPLQLRKQLPLPHLHSNSVMVKTIEVGVCGTNHAALGSQTGSFQPSVIDFHEAFGQVVWTGEDVQNVGIGDYVVPMVRRCETWDEPSQALPVMSNSFTFQTCDHNHLECYGHPDECPAGEYHAPQDSTGRRVGYKSRGTGKCHGFGSQYFIDTADWLVRVPPPSNGTFTERMLNRFVLTEPMSVVWKAHREIVSHYSIHEYSDRVLLVGLGPIGLLAGLVMKTLHPGLRYTGVDLVDDDNPRVQVAERYLELRYRKAPREDVAPDDLREEKFDIIIEATDQPDKVFKYAAPLLAPGGIMMLIGISEHGGSVDLMGSTVTRFVKSRNILIGSINSSRSDFEDSIAFMQKAIGERDSLLDDPRFAERWRIDGRIGQRLQHMGATSRAQRREMKVVLSAGELTRSVEDVIDAVPCDL